MITAAAIHTGAAALGVVLDTEQGERLLAFGELLLRWNAVHNLIARADEARLIPRHLLDSLSLAPLLATGRILDVGTGAGLPGIPLAIARPDCSFVLLDRSERKLRFARHVVGALGLDHVRVVTGTAAGYAAAALFDTIVSRAVAPPAQLWPEVRRLLAPNGVALLQCADPSSLKMPPMAVTESKPIVIPGLESPHWVLHIEARA